MILARVPVLSLILTLLFAAGTGALARGGHPGAGTGTAMVICGAGGQALTVFVDANGNRTLPSHDCAHCVLATATLPTLPDLGIRLTLVAMVPFLPGNPAPYPDTLAEPQARGPPWLA